jgi:predicted enzyme related to lactoylglutathione lyase
MAIITQHAPGTFCWPELATTDQNGAKKFYTALFGWTSDDSPIGENEFYTMLQSKGHAAGALYTMRKEMRENHVPPHWGSYVAVENTDQSAAKARQLGGKVIAEPFDVMDAGRMAVIQDPTGAVFSLWQAMKHPGIGVFNEPGALCWTELITTDTDAAKRFYTGLFPWQTESMDGGMPYTVFKVGENRIGGMMQRTPEMGNVPPFWLAYFEVDDCDAATAKALSLGGKALMPAQEVPSYGKIAVLQDPQGASFGLHSTKK